MLANCARCRSSWSLMPASSGQTVRQPLLAGRKHSHRAGAQQVSSRWCNTSAPALPAGACLAWYESKYNALTHANNDGSTDYGWWQINNRCALDCGWVGRAQPAGRRLCCCQRGASWHTLVHRHRSAPERQPRALPYRQPPSQLTGGARRSSHPMLPSRTRASQVLVLAWALSRNQQVQRDLFLHPQQPHRQR